MRTRQLQYQAVDRCRILHAEATLAWRAWRPKKGAEQGLPTMGTHRKIDVHCVGPIDESKSIGSKNSTQKAHEHRHTHAREQCVASNDWDPELCKQSRNT